MRVMEMTVELLGDRELLINGENWQASRSKAMINEDLAGRLTLEQQWALLSMLQQATMRLHHVYQACRMKAGDVLPSDLERMERMRKAPKPRIPQSKVIIVEG